MDAYVIKALGDKQKEHLKASVISLYNYILYSHFDSSLAIDGKADVLLKALEDFYWEAYGSRKQIKQVRK